MNIVSFGETAVGMDHADMKKIVFFWDVDFVNFLRLFVSLLSREGELREK